MADTDYSFTRVGQGSMEKGQGKTEIGWGNMALSQNKLKRRKALNLCWTCCLISSKKQIQIPFSCRLMKGHIYKTWNKPYH